MRIGVDLSSPSISWPTEKKAASTLSLKAATGRSLIAFEMFASIRACAARKWQSAKPSTSLCRNWCPSKWVHSAFFGYNSLARPCSVFLQPSNSVQCVILNHPLFFHLSSSSNLNPSKIAKITVSFLKALRSSQFHPIFFNMDWSRKSPLAFSSWMLWHGVIAKAIASLVCLIAWRLTLRTLSRRIPTYSGEQKYFPKHLINDDYALNRYRLNISEQIYPRLRKQADHVSAVSISP